MRKNEKITALYERLSRDDFGKDDDQQRESNSCLLYTSCLGRCKASGPACTRWICWWGCAAVLACVWRCISKVKTPRSTVTAWSMVCLLYTSRCV